MKTLKEIDLRSLALELAIKGHPGSPTPELIASANLVMDFLNGKSASEDKVRRLTRKEASQHLLAEHGIEIAVATLAKWACQDGRYTGPFEAPPFERSGRQILYRQDALDAWAVRRLGSRMSVNEVPAESAAVN